MATPHGDSGGSSSSSSGEEVQRTYARRLRVCRCLDAREVARKGRRGGKVLAQLLRKLGESWREEFCRVVLLSASVLRIQAERL